MVRWYADLMTDAERKALRHLSVTLKATNGSDVAAQLKARQTNAHARFLSSDSEVLRLTRDGYDAFVARTTARILHENDARLEFNRCPSCNALARTPTSKQCRFCGHDWHGR